MVQFRLARKLTVTACVAFFAGTTSSILAPTVASAAITFTKVVTGTQHSCALTSTGGVYCWGSNGSGQLGNGTRTSSAVPVPVTGISSGATAIAAGGLHTCAIVGGAAKCWGSGLFGQLGISIGLASYTPIQVVGLTANVSSITAGNNHTCAVQASTLLCWGDNFQGQLGDGTTNQRPTPVTVTGYASGAISVEAGDDHTCARVLTSGARCWGRNFSGQLGNSSYSTSYVPVVPTGLTTGVNQVSAGLEHSCAIVGGADVNNCLSHFFSC